MSAELWVEFLGIVAGLWLALMLFDCFVLWPREQERARYYLDD